MQNFISLVLLGGTSLFLLGSCLIQASGTGSLIIGGVVLFFSLGFWSHLRTLRRQS